MTGDWFTVAQVARRFGVTPRRVRALIADRQPRTMRIGVALLVWHEDVAALKPRPQGAAGHRRTQDRTHHPCP